MTEDISNLRRSVDVIISDTICDDISPVGHRELPIEVV